MKVDDAAAWGGAAYRTGRLVRLAAGLEEQGRMARLLVAVEDPLTLKTRNAGQPRLLIGSYVRVEIEGVELDSVAAVERSLVRDGNQVWIMGADGGLDIRSVEIAFRGRDRVLISAGVEPGERLLTTDLPAPVQGMPLRARTGAAPSADQLVVSEVK